MKVRNRLKFTLVLLLASVAPVLGAGGSTLRDYGEYLSGACMSCHRTSGAATAIPALKNMGSDHIVEALHAYKSGKRSNPVMVSVARALSEEQITALAAYFATASTPDAQGSVR